MSAGRCAMGASVLCLALVGCGAAKGVCQVVDTVHDACVVLEFTGADGGTDRVQVPAESLSGYAKAASAGGKSVSVSDAGCR